ncbi:MAG: glycosyltransferase family 4 protein [Bdellovibrionaceae bacterium]|nr:glycosyltransferase family 4 protein [Pseudobdellovibrionaceae bacterium]
MLTKKLKILLILVEPPLPFGNAASRWFHVLLKGLIKRGHNVDVLVASGVANDIAKAQKIFKDDKKFFMFPFGKTSSILGKLQTLFYPHLYMFSEEFKQKMSELNPDLYDIIHIEQTWAGWVGIPFRNKCLINVHHLQMIDLEFVSPPSFKQRILYQTWFWAEKRILSHFPYVRVCSPRLTSYIQKWGEKKLIENVPVALDFSLYPYIPENKRQQHTPIITVIGNMTWYPSISAALRLLNELWPSIKEQVPNAKLRVVGWSARSALKDYLHLPDLEVFENVPDIQPYFEEASVMVYTPSRGSGMKIKILESLAFGIPVVTTSEGSEGLPAEDMVHMGICEDNAGLIERTVQILKNPNLQESLRKNGRELATQHCGEETTVTQIEDIYKKMLSL